MKIIRYNSTLEDQWNSFIASAVNGVFLFDRRYMDYHADRFNDHSLVVLDERDRWLAVVPAANDDAQWVTHPGLSYGGFVFADELSQGKVNECLRLCLGYLKDQKIIKITFKLTPDIYSDFPAKSLEYALFTSGFTLYRRDASTTLYLDRHRKKTKGRIAAIKKAKKLDLVVDLSGGFEQFMALENENLRSKYGVSAVHSSAEISMLAERFPKNILLFTAVSGDELLAGGVVYISRRVMHLQYMATSEQGAALSAGDLVIDAMLTHCLSLEINIFDFGISTENDGHYLNTGLIKYKESFGGRTTLADFYRYELP